MLPWETSLDVGLYLSVAGFVIGLPTGAVYHVVLWRALKQLPDGVPKGWIWNPIAHHHRLPRHALRRVHPWFFCGGFGFVVISAGLVMMVLAMISVFVGFAG
jgi:hypothetical protein